MPTYLCTPGCVLVCMSVRCRHLQIRRCSAGRPPNSTCTYVKGLAQYRYGCSWYKAEAGLRQGTRHVSMYIYISTLHALCVDRQVPDFIQGAKCLLGPAIFCQEGRVECYRDLPTIISVSYIWYCESNVQSDIVSPVSSISLYFIQVATNVTPLLPSFSSFQGSVSPTVGCRSLR